MSDHACRYAKCPQAAIPSSRRSLTRHLGLEQRLRAGRARRWHPRTRPRPSRRSRRCRGAGAGPASQEEEHARAEQGRDGESEVGRSQGSRRLTLREQRADVLEGGPRESFDEFFGHRAIRKEHLFHHQPGSVGRRHDGPHDSANQLPDGVFGRFRPGHRLPDGRLHLFGNTGHDRAQ